MIFRLAIRNIVFRPWRSLLLFTGYGVGVGVMIVLLAVGDALITQARDERLVGGGDITVLPEGLDVEVMKTGGVGGLFFSIDHARFIQRQILASSRLSGAIRAVAPQIDGKLLYLSTSSRHDIPVRALGELPSQTRAVGAALDLLAGQWVDDDGDRQFRAPTRAELWNEIDHFHIPPATTEHPESWGEWHYFNVISDDRKRWAFLSFLVGGDVQTVDQWGGRVAVTLHDDAGNTTRYVTDVPARQVQFSTTSANLRIGDAAVTVLPDGRYAVRGTAREERGARMLTIDLVVTPASNAYFPSASLGSRDFISGYVVPGLRASATGRICEDAHCERYDNAQSYHDHNWGVWRSVTWDWGASRAGSYTMLYGRVIPPAELGEAPSLFVYLVDSIGFRAVFRPKRIAYADNKTVTLGGKSIRVPSSAAFADVRGRDTLKVELTIESAVGTDTRTPLLARGDVSGAKALIHPYFIQMKGTATISGRVGGVPVQGSGTGFFETYR